MRSMKLLLATLVLSALGCTAKPTVWVCWTSEFRPQERLDPAAKGPALLRGDAPAENRDRPPLLLVTGEVLFKNTSPRPTLELHDGADSRIGVEFTEQDVVLHFKSHDTVLRIRPGTSVPHVNVKTGVTELISRESVRGNQAIVETLRQGEARVPPEEPAVEFSETGLSELLNDPRRWTPGFGH